MAFPAEETTQDKEVTALKRAKLKLETELDSERNEAFKLRERVHELELDVREGLARVRPFRLAFAPVGALTDSLIRPAGLARSGKGRPGGRRAEEADQRECFSSNCSPAWLTVRAPL